jgi:hypothetical protein
MTTQRVPPPVPTAPPLVWLNGFLPWGKGASNQQGWILTADAMYVVSGPTTFGTFPLFAKICGPIGLLGCLPLLLLAAAMLPIVMFVNEPNRRRAWAQFLDHDLSAVTQTKYCKRFELSRIIRGLEHDPATGIMKASVDGMKRPLLIGGVDPGDCIAFASEVARRCAISEVERP